MRNVVRTLPREMFLGLDGASASLTSQTPSFFCRGSDGVLLGPLLGLERQNDIFAPQLT